MASGSPSTAGIRTLLSWLLLLLAAAAVPAAVAVAWADGAFVRPGALRGALEGLLGQRAVREALVERVLQEALGRPAGADDEALVEAVASGPVWETEAVRGAFGDAVEGAQAVLDGDDAGDVRMDGSAIVTALADAAAARGDGASEATLRARPAPFPVTLVEGLSSRSLAAKRETTGKLPLLLLGVTVVFALAGVRLAPDRGTAAGRFVLLATVLAFVAMVATAVGPGGVLPSSAIRADESPLVVFAGRELARGLRSRLMIVVIAGGLLWLLRWRLLSQLPEEGTP